MGIRGGRRSEKGQGTSTHDYFLVSSIGTRCRLARVMNGREEQQTGCRRGIVNGTLHQAAKQRVGCLQAIVEPRTVLRCFRCHRPEP